MRTCDAITNEAYIHVLFPHYQRSLFPTFCTLEQECTDTSWFHMFRFVYRNTTAPKLPILIFRFTVQRSILSQYTVHRSKNWNVKLGSGVESMCSWLRSDLLRHYRASDFIHFTFALSTLQLHCLCIARDFYNDSDSACMPHVHTSITLPTLNACPLWRSRFQPVCNAATIESHCQSFALVFDDDIAANLEGTRPHWQLIPNANDLWASRYLAFPITV